MLVTRNISKPFKTLLHNCISRENYTKEFLKCKNINFTTRNQSNSWMWQGPKPPKGEYQLQKYEYLLVLDFEATCGNQGSEPKPQEIIEFPCALLSTKKNFEVVSIFHKYVRPIHNPILTTFCTELTGITQVSG